MPEWIDLTTPVDRPSQTAWSLSLVTIRVPEREIVVELVGTNGERLIAHYPTPAPADHPEQPTGADLLTALNTADLTSTSLVKRVFARLIADGYVSGTVTGTPD